MIRAAKTCKYSSCVSYKLLEYSLLPIARDPTIQNVFNITATGVMPCCGCKISPVQINSADCILGPF